MDVDAAFTISDTVCFGTTVKPQNMDTSFKLRNFWRYQKDSSDKIMPEIVFLSAGIQKVFHSVSDSVCTDTTSRTVQVLALPKIALNDTLVCGPNQLSVNLTDANTTKYFLNGQPTPPQYILDKTGIFTVKLSNPNCFLEKTVNVKIVPFPSPLQENDTAYCNGVPVAVTFKGNFENISWDNKLAKDTFFVEDGVRHTFRATYSLDKACRINDTFFIRRKSCPYQFDVLFIPNSFSPNSDGTNDVFEVYSTKNAEFQQMSVYNRWGNRVFQSSDATKSWDGTLNRQLLSPDVYIYWVRFKNLKTGRLEIVSGDVSLIK